MTGVTGLKSIPHHNYYGEYLLGETQKIGTPVSIHAESGEFLTEIPRGLKSLFLSVSGSGTARRSTEEFKALGSLKSSRGELSAKAACAILADIFPHRLQVYGGRYSSSVFWQDEAMLSPQLQPYAPVALEFEEFTICHLNRDSRPYEMIVRNSGAVAAQLKPHTFDVLSTLVENIGSYVHWSEVQTTENYGNEHVSRTLFKESAADIQKQLGGRLVLSDGVAGIGVAPTIKTPKRTLIENRFKPADTNSIKEILEEPIKEPQAEQLVVETINNNEIPDVTCDVLERPESVNILADTTDVLDPKVKEIMHRIGLLREYAPHSKDDHEVFAALQFAKTWKPTTGAKLKNDIDEILSYLKSRQLSREDLLTLPPILIKKLDQNASRVKTARAYYFS